MESSPSDILSLQSKKGKERAKSESKRRSDRSLCIWLHLQIASASSFEFQMLFGLVLQSKNKAIAVRSNKFWNRMKQ